MSCGCAVLVSDVAGAGEIVNGENGLKVRLSVPDEFIREYAEKIVALAQNHELRASLGERARKFVRREHDWDRIGEQVLAVYEELEREYRR
jgi:glycosyltransferase involved in cell wall biosynthesis